ncbi:hypothetical protein SDC9_112895 [bioreactor metagenome]|uniref:Uncharacterized protein n=1 Tax=bioreactor metagenome TaxID=1076179 RepID=A0A645BN53_9ZZZZ
MAGGLGCCGDRQRQAVGHAQLFDHQVHTRGLFGDGVLDLQARVHFKEGDRAGLAQQVFHRARAHITRPGADVARGLVDAFALLVAQEGRGRFFHQLLIAALQRAVARAQHHHVAVRVGNHLSLDVARLVEELFDEAFAAAKGGDGFARGRGEELFHLVHAPCDLHAAPAAAERGLDDDGQAVLLGKGQHVRRVLHRVLGACDQRRAHIQRHFACADLVAQQCDGFGLGADPDQARVEHGPCKGFAFRQKAVAGVHSVGTAFLGDVDDFGDI